MKIVFCMPGRMYSREFLLCWSDLMMQCANKGHSVMISQQYSSCVHFARAKCLGGDVLKGKDQKPFQGELEYDAMVWIDSDILFKPEDIFSLIESPHDVTAAVYMMEDLQHFATVEEWNKEFFAKKGTFKFLRPDDIIGSPQYKQVAYTGMGLMVIRKGVVEDLKYPWFNSELEKINDDIIDMNSEDVAFCKALWEAGHPIHIDTKIRVGHQKLIAI